MIERTFHEIVKKSLKFNTISVQSKPDLIFSLQEIRLQRILQENKMASFQPSMILLDFLDPYGNF